MASQVLDAQNTKIFIANAPITTSPTTYVQITEIRSISFDGSRNERQVTNLDSVAQEFRLSLQDFGTMSCEVGYASADAGQVLLDTALASSSPWEFKIIYSGGAKTAWFQGLVKSWPMPSADVDGDLKRSLQVRVTGSVQLI